LTERLTPVKGSPFSIVAISSFLLLYFIWLIGEKFVDLE
jgi:hypothetical protein